MGKRKRIRIKVGELGALIYAREKRKEKMFGEVITDIMHEIQCTWTEAKEIYKRRRLENAIKREMNLIQ
jgi:hypothetical protein